MILRSLVECDQAPYTEQSTAKMFERGADGIPNFCRVVSFDDAVFE
jgi:hypothetical protein